MFIIVEFVYVIYVMLKEVFLEYMYMYFSVRWLKIYLELLLIILRIYVLWIII